MRLHIVSTQIDISTFCLDYVQLLESNRVLIFEIYILLKNILKVMFILSVLKFSLGNSIPRFISPESDPEFCENLNATLIFLKSQKRISELELVLSQFINYLLNSQKFSSRFTLFDLYFKLFYASFKNQSFEVCSSCLKFLIEHILTSIRQKISIGNSTHSYVC